MKSVTFKIPHAEYDSFDRISKNVNLVCPVFPEWSMKVRQFKNHSVVRITAGLCDRVLNEGAYMAALSPFMKRRLLKECQSQLQSLMKSDSSRSLLYGDQLEYLSRISLDAKPSGSWPVPATYSTPNQQPVAIRPV